MTRKSTLRRVRKWKGRGRTEGFILTWDVDSADRAAASRLRRFVYGSSAERGARTYRYPGFVEKMGVRYVGQSVLFVPAALLAEIESFLIGAGVDHETFPAGLG